MSVTIKQIAELANVSRGTVDKVLNNRPGVKEATREKVLRISKELNYQPNLLGKALVQSQKPLKIGILLVQEFNPFVQDMISGIHRAAEEFAPFGLEVLIRTCTFLEPAEQLSIINDFISQNVSGMSVFPIDDRQVVSRINQLSKASLPVVTFNSRLSDINDLCFIGQDHYKGGRVAASLVRKLLPGKKKIGLIISSSKLSCHLQRQEGFLDVLAGDENVEIIDIKENQDRRDTAFSIALGYCNKHPDINALYITGGGVSGVGSALEIAETAGPVHVICHDLTNESIDLLRSGTVDFVLGQAPEEQGYQSVKILFDYLAKKITPPPVLDIPISIHIAESM